MRWPWQQKNLSIETIIERLEAVNRTVSGINITPDNCMMSPTMQAIVTAVSRRIAASPVQVMRQQTSGTRTTKEPLPEHPVARLLSRPNEWQTPNDYWLDSVSSYMRWGRYHAFKGRGQTGPIRRLIPLESGQVDPMARIDDSGIMLGVEYRVSMRNGGFDTFSSEQIHTARGAARDFIRGDSPVADVKEAIAMEVACERFGAGFFGNGAMPLIFLKRMEGFRDFPTDEARDQFVKAYQNAFSGKSVFKSALLPKGIEPQSMPVDNEKAQFNETRKLLRTIIAGAFNCPAHVAGDLEHMTMNNLEGKEKDFNASCVLPIARSFEDAMERDLLTQADRNGGVIIRFNLDAPQRVNFAERQEGYRLQREMGVISANDWREQENMNPISADDGGDDYIRPLNMGTAEQQEADNASESSDASPGLQSVR